MMTHLQFTGFVQIKPQNMPDYLKKREGPHLSSNDGKPYMPDMITRLNELPGVKAEHRVQWSIEHRDHFIVTNNDIQQYDQLTSNYTRCVVSDREKHARLWRNYEGENLKRVYLDFTDETLLDPNTGQFTEKAFNQIKAALGHGDSI